MRWQGRRGSSNVEDRRSMKAPAIIGGGGILAVIIAVVFALANGVDLPQALQQGANKMKQQAAAQGGAAGPRADNSGDLKDDPQAKFASVVLKDTEDVWNDLFPKVIGKRYQEPILVLFRDSVSSACGRATASVGPFYCPRDNQIYLDLSFFEEMRSKFNAPGDFACAYVIAHEVGHHIQNLLGVSMDIQQRQRRASKVESNNLSVRLELQADFLAGVWAHHAQKTKKILEVGDLKEAIGAAQAIGDDTLQRKAQGQVRPDAFTHGSAEQRMRWFTYGLKSGNMDEMTLLFENEYDQL